MSQYGDWQYVLEQWATASVRGIDTNDDGRYMAVAYGSTLSIFDCRRRPPAGDFAPAIHDFSLAGDVSTSAGNVVSFRPNSTEVAVCNQTGTVEIYDASSGSRVTELDNGGSYSRGATWRSDGNELFYCSDETIYVVDATTWSLIDSDTPDSGQTCRSASWASDNSGVAVVTSNDLYIYDTGTWSPTQIHSIDGTAGGVAYSPDTSMVAHGDWNNVFAVYDTSDWSELFSETIGGSIYDMQFTEDNNYVAYGEGSGGDTLYIRNTNDWSLEMNASPGSGGIEDVAFTPDEGHLIMVDRSWRIGVWETPFTRDLTVSVSHPDGSAASGAEVTALDREYGVTSVITETTNSSGTATLSVPSYYRAGVIVSHEDGDGLYHTQLGVADDRGGDESLSLTAVPYTRPDGDLEFTYESADGLDYNGTLVSEADYNGEAITRIYHNDGSGEELVWEATSPFED